MKPILTIDTKAFNKDCQALITATRKATEEEVQRACQEIFKDSQSEVPVDTGALKQSGYFKVTYKDDDYDGIIEYGGPNSKTNPISGKSTTDYATEVHENLIAHHDIGKAKFLEDPVNRYEISIEQTWTQRLSKAITSLFRR